MELLDSYVDVSVDAAHVVSSSEVVMQLPIASQGHVVVYFNRVRCLYINVFLFRANVVHHQQDHIAADNRLNYIGSCTIIRHCSIVTTCRNIPFIVMD